MIKAQSGPLLGERLFAGQLSDEFGLNKDWAIELEFIINIRILIDNF